MLVLTVIGGALVWGLRSRLPKRFSEVVPAQLYRCGTVSPAQLRELHAKYGIRTVLSLLNPEAPESVAERTAAESLHINWLNVPLRGNGASTPADRERIKSIITDDSLGPILVHCAAGTNRTGLAIGLYRIHRQGWSAEQVLEEMKRFDFEDDSDHENLRAAIISEAGNRP